MSKYLIWPRICGAQPANTAFYGSTSEPQGLAPWVMQANHMQGHSSAGASTIAVTPNAVHIKWNAHLLCIHTGTHRCCSNPPVDPKEKKQSGKINVAAAGHTQLKDQELHTAALKKCHKMLWWSHPQEMVFSGQCLSHKLVTQTLLYPCKSISSSSTGTSLQEDKQSNALQPVLGWENECEFSQETWKFLCMSCFYCTWDRLWPAKLSRIYLASILTA